MKKIYLFDGCVISFGRIVTNKARLKTVAISSKKAISNLKFQSKQRLSWLPFANITLQGTITTGTFNENGEFVLEDSYKIHV